MIVNETAFFVTGIVFLGIFATVAYLNHQGHKKDRKK